MTDRYDAMAERAASVLVPKALGKDGWAWTELTVAVAVAAEIRAAVAEERRANAALARSPGFDDLSPEITRLRIAYAIEIRE